MELQVRPEPGSTVLLEARLEAFAQHYCLTGSTSKAGAAAIKAGSAPHNKGGAGGAGFLGRQLLQHPDVIDRIRWLNHQQFKSVEAAAVEVKRELARIAFAKASDLVDANGHLIALQDLPDDVAATITGIDVEVQDKVVKDHDGNTTVEQITVKKIRRADKMAALTLLARHFKVVGAEEDGINSLAGALADRLGAAKRRLLDPSQPVEDARIIEPRQVVETVPLATAQEIDDEQLW